MKYLYLVFMVIFVLFGGIEVDNGQIMTGAVSLALGAFWAYKALAEKPASERTLELDGVEEEQAQFLRESYEKAAHDFGEIQSTVKQIQDRELVQQVAKMQRVANNLLYYLQQHPQKIPLARKFIDYYQDRTAVMLKKYHTLEATQLQTENVQETKQRLKMTLGTFDEAYEEQFARVLDDHIMDMDAELTVMQQTVRADGIKGRGRKRDLPQMDIEANWTPEQRKANLEKAREFSIVPTDEREHVIRTKLIAAGLGIFLGGLGAHKFYLGKSRWGILYLLLCWTTIPGFLGFAEGIRYLFMKVDDFYEQYYQ